MTKFDAAKTRAFVADCERHIRECVGNETGRRVVLSICGNVPGMAGMVGTFGAGGSPEINPDGPTQANLNTLFSYARACLDYIEGIDTSLNVLTADSVNPNWRDAVSVATALLQARAAAEAEASATKH